MTLHLGANYNQSMSIERKETGELVEGVKVYRVEPDYEVMEKLMHLDSDLFKQKIIRYRAWDVENRVNEILSERGLAQQDLKKLLNEKKIPLVLDADTWNRIKDSEIFQFSWVVLNLCAALDIQQHELQVVHEFVNPLFDSVYINESLSLSSSKKLKGTSSMV